MRSDIARGHYCPKEHQQHLELAAFYPKIAVAYTQIATISTDPHHVLQEFCASVGAQRTFLSDPGRAVQKDLDIQEYTDPEHDPMIPHTLVLKPGLVIHSIYNGYWYWGRPSVDDLTRDLRAVTSEIRPTGTSAPPGCAKPGTPATSRLSTVGTSSRRRPRRPANRAAGRCRRRCGRPTSAEAAQATASSQVHDHVVVGCRTVDKDVAVGDCKAAQALATSSFASNGERCGHLRVKSYTPVGHPATPGNEAIFSTNLITQGGDGSMPDGLHTRFYRLTRQADGAWRVASGGGGP